MAAVFFLVALVMVLAGAASIYYGALIFAFSTGTTLVSVGVVALTGGVLLAGLAALIGLGRRIADALDALGEVLLAEQIEARPAPPLRRGDGERPRVSGTVPPPSEPPAAMPPEPAPPARRGDETAEEKPLGALEGLRGTLPAPEAPPPAEPSVAGTYSAGGHTYVMYSDGTIQAETPDGRFRFDTLDELKAFIAKGERKG